MYNVCLYDESVRYASSDIKDCIEYVKRNELERYKAYLKNTGYTGLGNIYPYIAKLYIVRDKMIICNIRDICSYEKLNVLLGGKQ